MLVSRFGFSCGSLSVVSLHFSLSHFVMFMTPISFSVVPDSYVLPTLQLTSLQTSVCCVVPLFILPFAINMAAMKCACNENGISTSCHPLAGLSQGILIGVTSSGEVTLMVCPLLASSGRQGMVMVFMTDLGM